MLQLERGYAPSQPQLRWGGEVFSLGKKFMEIVLATTNLYKILKFSMIFLFLSILSSVEFLSILDLLSYTPPESKGKTFESYTFFKATTAAQAIGKKKGS